MVKKPIHCSNNDSRNTYSQMVGKVLHSCGASFAIDDSHEETQHNQSLHVVDLLLGVFRCSGVCRVDAVDPLILRKTLYSQTLCYLLLLSVSLIFELIISSFLEFWLS